ncbi:MAG TPA: GH1 family beta-glucosidase [Bacteroidia bacterium]|nr:GH1 family beta-glucosidase [Bacteroidia bacterium]
MNASDFGDDFCWGVSTSAYQIEGAYNEDGKGPSIWDVFSNTPRKIYQNHNGNKAADFYNFFRQDILLLKSLGIRHFRFSISWSRLLPNGTGAVNEKGIQFYHKVIDTCLENGIVPWVTLYHWDLPYALEKKGGWPNRAILDWFKEYVELCVKHFGSKVKHWMVLNEPIAFTGGGYFLGIHAPGRTGLPNFLPAIHHASLCQRIGFQIIKEKYPESEVGSTFSFSHMEPFITPNLKGNVRNQEACKRVDAILNRMAIEPTLGLFYPHTDLKVLKAIEKYVQKEDEANLKTPFDFVGLQVYTREVVKHSYFVPYLKAKLIHAYKRDAAITSMNWEVHPPCMYEVIKKVAAYTGVKKIIITENGAAFNDVPDQEGVRDTYRTDYLRKHIAEVKRAKDEGINVKGYFVWSFIDNFEWSEGYFPRFGIVYVDFNTQQRIVKDSGYWYSEFLRA